VEVVASLSQGRTAAAQCGLFTHKSVPVIFEPPCTNHIYSARITSQHTNLVRNNDVCLNARYLFLKAEMHVTAMPILSPCMWNQTVPV